VCKTTISRRYTSKHTHTYTNAIDTHTHTHTHKHTHTHTHTRTKAMELFSSKLLIQDVQKLVAAGGGGLGGQDWDKGNLFELNEQDKKVIAKLTRHEKLRKIAQRLKNKIIFKAFSKWRDVYTWIPFDMEKIGMSVEQEINLHAISRSGSSALGGTGAEETLRAGKREKEGGRGYNVADRDDKVLAALQGIWAKVDDLSRRFSHFEQELETERQRQAGVTACQTSIDNLSHRFLPFSSQQEAGRQQAQHGY
jgi:hypothetical protein